LRPPATPQAQHAAASDGDSIRKRDTRSRSREDETTIDARPKRRKKRRKEKEGHDGDEKSKRKKRKEKDKEATENKVEDLDEISSKEKGEEDSEEKGKQKRKRIPKNKKAMEIIVDDADEKELSAKTAKARDIGARHSPATPILSKSTSISPFDAPVKPASETVEKGNSPAVIANPMPVPTVSPFALYEPNSAMGVSIVSSSAKQHPTWTAPPQCRRGPWCHFLARGVCQYYHPPEHYAEVGLDYTLPAAAGRRWNVWVK
jgi:hypothetical protein